MLHFFFEGFTKGKVQILQLGGVLTGKFPKKNWPKFHIFLKTSLITCSYYDHQTPHLLNETDQTPTPLQMLPDTETTPILRLL